MHSCAVALDGVDIRRFIAKAKYYDMYSRFWKEAESAENLGEVEVWSW